MSSTIRAIGHHLAMDGQTYFSTNNANANQSQKASVAKVENVMQEPQKVAESLVKNLEKVKQDFEELQKIAHSVGHEVQFNVNEELGQVVFKIVDPNTDKVIKEIPSADVQQVQIKLRETLGLLVDEKI